MSVEAVDIDSRPDIIEVEGWVSIRSRATLTDGTKVRSRFVLRAGAVDWIGWDEDRPNEVTVGLKGTAMELNFEGYSPEELLPYLTGHGTDLL